MLKEDKGNVFIILKEIDFIKIDVEGYEFEVLNGSIATLTEHHPLLQIEIVFSYRSEDIFSEVWEFLGGFGYKAYFVSNGELRRLDQCQQVENEHNYYFSVKWSINRLLKWGLRKKLLYYLDLILSC